MMRSRSLALLAWMAWLVGACGGGDSPPRPTDAGRDGALDGQVEGGMLDGASDVIGPDGPSDALNDTAGDDASADAEPGDDAMADGGGDATGTGCTTSADCGPGQQCVAGACTCLEGRADCNGVAADGCEVDLGSDLRHCGRCGNACDDGNVCTDDRCDAMLGCISEPNRASCDDGNACTSGDVCADGRCVGTPLACDDGNPCTSDRCDPGSGCVHEPVRDGTSCDDGNACTLADACRAGRCEGGTTRVCLDPHACTADSCNPATGMCVFTPDDSRCDDGNVCTADRCDPARGCVSSPVRDGTSCDDGNACTMGDTCQRGRCTAGTARICMDAHACTADSCNPATGMCVFTPDDSRCDDGNVCTADRCDPARGCVSSPVRDGMRCDDGNVCTVEDACRGGTCTGRARSCDDGIRCTVDSCDPGRGGCVHTPQDRLCDDGDDCTVDRCLPTAGCVYASIC